MARKNALQIINAFCHQIKSMEFKFWSLSLINFDLFGQKFGDKIKEIKLKYVCINISRLLSFSRNKKCKVKLIYKIYFSEIHKIVGLGLHH
jgi:hypothetical protein